MVQAVTLHGLSYANTSRLYDVADETIRKWVNSASDVPVGLDRLEALEHRMARIEHYLALAEGIRQQDQDGSWRRDRVERGNGHNGFEAVPGLARAAALPSEGGGTGS